MMNWKTTSIILMSIFAIMVMYSVTVGKDAKIDLSMDNNTLNAFNRALDEQQPKVSCEEGCYFVYDNWIGDVETMATKTKDCIRYCVELRVDKETKEVTFDES